MKLPRSWLKMATISALCGGGLLFVGLLVLVTGSLAQTAADPHAESIRVLEDSISLLKWVGGGVVTGLVTAVGLLYRALEKSNVQSRSDILAGLSSREALVVQSLETSLKLQERVQDLNEKVTKLVEKHGTCPYADKVKG